MGVTLVGNAASAAPLQSGTFSFAISSTAPPAGSCVGPSDDGCIHSLTSVTIGGTTYTDFTFPTGFAVGGFSSGANVQSRIQGVVGDFVFSSPTYAADMLANVFSDMDLNKYQQVDGGASNGFSTFTYPNSVPATDDFYFITTERNGNNDQIIQAFDAAGNPLGSVTVNRLSPDYTDTGRNVGVSQNSFLAIIPMSDFNISSDPLNPSEVRSLRISYNGNDGADHKTFIIGSQTIGAVVANDDDYTTSPVDGVAGGTVGTVLDNDDLNGGDAATDGSQTTITVTNDDGLTGVTIADNGTITVPAGSAPGTYSVVYELCDEANPTICDTATAVVVVSAPAIDADDDDYSATPVDGVAGGTAGSVLDNDELAGSAVATDGSQTTITVTNDDGLTGVTIADNGTITVPAGSAPGTYSVAYELCDEANPTICDTAVATIVVSPPPIDAVDDDYTTSPVVGTTGGTVGSVLDNDFLNGSAVATDGSETTITVTDADGLTGVTIADDGTITVPAGTPIGSYTIEYDLCDEANPTICDTATAVVVVGAPAIDAVDDDFSLAPVDGAAGGTAGSVLGNDERAGTAVATDGSETTITVTNPDGLAGVTIADDGTITVPAGTAAGTYDVVYRLCDEAAPTTCDTATATVVVSAPAIDAVDDTFASSPVNTVAGGTIGSVLGNDTLGGSAVAGNGSQTTLTLTNADGLTGVALADDGTITVPAGTPVGTYNVVYQLCDEVNPTNCDTATATIVVDATDLIDAIAEDLTTILEDDLAVTMAEQGARMGDYATGALERLKSRTGQQCAAAANLHAKSIFFDTDKAIITPQSADVLDQIAGILATCSGSAFEIGGHTDSRASDAYNIALSQRRVNAVLRALSDRDIDISGFVARGYGERRPVASNDTVAGMAQNRRVEFALIEDGAVHHNTCGDAAGTSRALDASADETGVTVNGSLFEERHDCANDRWSIIEGTVSYVDIDSGLSQTALNLSYRRERFVAPDTVRGYFVGLYGSQSDVNREAIGEIDGVGVNAGIYGAKRLRDNLFFDYYLGAATGVHEFDLAFDDALGTIMATGDYTYLAGFAGAAISGELDYGEYTLSPRTGIELAYSPGGDVGVEAALGGVTQSGTLALDSVSGAAVFAEIRAERGFNDDRSLVALTPRLTCYQSIGSLGSDCSVGAALELATSDETRGLGYAVRLEGERGSAFTSGSISASVSRAIGHGTLNANAGVTRDGALNVGGLFEVKF
ncbi:MAG: OmpA family protein [Pseudomonadota bacterium]